MARIRVVTPDKKNKIVIQEEELQDYLAQGYMRLDDWMQQEVEKAKAAWLASALALAQKKADKAAEIETGYQAALAASLTMPQDAPSHADIAVGAALFANEDAEGLEYIANTHAQRRAALLNQVEMADSLDEIEKITANFAV